MLRVIGNLKGYTVTRLAGFFLLVIVNCVFPSVKDIYSLGHAQGVDDSVLIDPDFSQTRTVHFPEDRSMGLVYAGS